MSCSHSNSKSIIADIIREYTDCLTYNYKIYQEARSDYRDNDITTRNLIEIIITMLVKISTKYKQIASAIEIANMTKLRLDVYAQLANFIKYIDQKSIEMDGSSIEPKEVDSLLSTINEQVKLYLKELNQLAINENKLCTPSVPKKSCGLCLTIPYYPINDDLSRKCSPMINEKGFVYYEITSNQDEVESIKYPDSESSSSICLDDVPSYSPTEGLSPATSDTEDDSPLNPTIDLLIPDWQGFLNECLFKWYAMGGQARSSGCQEYMHLFLGGRRISSLHSPTVTPSDDISTPIENGPVVFRRTAARRQTRNCMSDEMNKILLSETDVEKHLTFKTCEKNIVIQCGVIDALIVYATEHLDSEFCDTFVSTYRSFITADELIEKLRFRYNALMDKNKDLQNKCYALIVKIAEKATRYSITEEFLISLVNFIHELVTSTNIVKAYEMRKIFNRNLEDYQTKQLLVKAIPDYLEDECGGTLLDFKPILIAQQMTLMAYELFTKIEVTELLVSEAKAETPNVTAFLHHCDKLSYWVTTMIGKLSGSRQIQKYIKYLVNVMKYLKEYRDFSSCWAILCGLQTTYIYKVTKRYEDMYKEFIELFSFSANYSNYRRLLKESKLPRIPLICIALHDLIYISEATKDFKSDEFDSSINFYRIWRQFKYIKVFKEEKSEYPFKKNTNVLAFFGNFNNHISLNKSSPSL